VTAAAYNTLCQWRENDDELLSEVQLESDRTGRAQVWILTFVDPQEPNEAPGQLVSNTAVGATKAWVQDEEGSMEFDSQGFPADWYSATAVRLVRRKAEQLATMAAERGFAVIRDDWAYVTLQARTIETF